MWLARSNAALSKHSEKKGNITEKERNANVSENGVLWLAYKR